MDNRTLSFVAAFVVTGLCAPVSAQMKPADLAQASLEDLMRIEITAAGRKEQRADSVAAAAFVLTADDIRRSGLRTLPDLTAARPWRAGRAGEQQSLGRVRSRLQQSLRQQAARPHRRTLCLQSRLLGGVLGRSGRARRGYRPHRSDPRAGRRPLGRQCGQRRYQHRDQDRGRDPRRPRPGECRHRRPRRGGRPLRWFARQRQISRVLAVVEPRRIAARWHDRRERQLGGAVERRTR